MRVRILSGNQAGAIVDVGPEGAIMLSNGFAELAPLEPPPPDAPVETLEAAAPDLPLAEGGSLADLDEGNDVAIEEPAPGTAPARVRKPRQKAATPKATSRRKRR